MVTRRGVHGAAAGGTRRAGPMSGVPAARIQGPGAAAGSPSPVRGLAAARRAAVGLRRDLGARGLHPAGDQLGLAAAAGAPARPRPGPEAPAEQEEPELAAADKLRYPAQRRLRDR